MQCFLVMHRLAEYKGAIYIFRSDPADHFLIGRFLCIASGQIRRRRIHTYTHTLLATSLLRHVASPHVSCRYVISPLCRCGTVPALSTTGFT